MSSASLPPDIDSGVTMVVRERFSYKAIRDVLSGLLEQDLHAKRVSSLCDATLGVLHSGSLAICTILESLGFAQNFLSSCELEALHFIGIGSFGDEFREAVVFRGIQEQFRKPLA